MAELSRAPEQTVRIHCLFAKSGSEVKPAYKYLARGYGTNTFLSQGRVVTRQGVAGQELAALTVLAKAQPAEGLAPER